MEFNATKTNEANAVVSATILADDIKKEVNKIAKQAAKTMDIQGFRKGKVPVAIVKQRYGDKLTQDAEGEIVRGIIDEALKELSIEASKLVGDPMFTKFDKKDDGSIEVEIKISCQPDVELGDYKSLLPEIDSSKFEVSNDEVTERIEKLAQDQGTLEKIKRKRAVKDGDFVLIDFEGFKDGEPFEGGKAEKYSLEIGSGSFIPGFEEQLVGMKYEEEKEITVTFPEEYQAKDLAGKEVVFKVKLHEIQEKVTPEIDDELAKKILKDEEATVETLREKIKEQLVMEKKANYFNEELKPAYLEKVVDSLDFAVPDSILEQEINNAINTKARVMSEEEINELKENKDKLKELTDEVTPEATKSVKATFIIDALAKAEGVEVSDQEVTQTIYYEAMMMGQNPMDTIKQYEEAGYLPAIKMSMIEHKVLDKLLNEKIDSDKE